MKESDGVESLAFEITPAAPKKGKKGGKAKAAESTKYPPLSAWKKRRLDRAAFFWLQGSGRCLNLSPLCNSNCD